MVLGSRQKGENHYHEQAYETDNCQDASEKVRSKFSGHKVEMRIGPTSGEQGCGPGYEQEPFGGAKIEGWKSAWSLCEAFWLAAYALTEWLLWRRAFHVA